MQNSFEDIDNLPAIKLRKIVLKLPAHLPITDEFEGRGCSDDGLRRAWYTTQRQHIAGWLSEYDTPGFYNRKKPGGGARNFYNRFKCAAGLLWLAEALGVSAQTLHTAVAAIDAAPRNPASECGAFRKVVPWSMIASLLQDHLAAQSEFGGVRGVFKKLRKAATRRGESR